MARLAGAMALMAALSMGPLSAAEGPFPLAPSEALAGLKLEPGLRIELVAAEPLVQSPVALAFDERGRLYVAENVGYPDPINENKEGVTHEGKIALLEDTDGDGVYDKRTDFATGLTYPNGVMPWRGGVFVTCSPDLYYFKDTDGDGVADVRRVVLTGFNDSRTAQIRASHPTLGLDGRVYVTAGLNGGKVTAPDHPERPAVEFSPSDTRFDPESFVLEVTGGRGQFGLTFDDFGRRFNVSNRHPVMQILLEPWYLRRNPYLAFSDTVQHVSKVEYEAKVFPISRAAVTADFIPSLMSKPHSGTFTSASGTAIFRGQGLGPDHYGNVFIAEPAQNVVQRQVMRPEGVSFRSDLPYENREFLSSADIWFRPVFVATGPEGALYVADMYRQVIDHPQYVPAEARGQFDFLAGKHRGRIYRIVKQDAPASRPVKLDTSTPALVRTLESAEGWQRDTARRLLLEGKDPAAVPLLEKVASGGARPESRVAALWLLHNFGRLSEPVLLAALKDRSAGVRENAALVVGERQEASPQLVNALLPLARDSDDRVRFNTALVLGSAPDDRVIPALAAIAARSGQDRWVRAAVLSGIGNRLLAFFEAFRQERSANPAAYAAVMQDLGQLFGAGGAREDNARFLAEMLKDASEADFNWRLPAVLGLADGLRSRKKSSENSLSALIDDTPEGRQVRAGLDSFFDRAGKVAANERATTAQRVTAAAFLGYADFDRAGPGLVNLLAPRYPTELQLEAVRSLERLRDPRAGELLTAPERWNRYTPRVRESVIASLSSATQLIGTFFDAIEKGVIRPTDVTPLRRGQLQKHANETIRERAKAVFKEVEGGDRMQAYQTARSVLDLSADVIRGQEVFVRACSACHAHSGSGGMVGPDLTGVRNQPADALLMHIIVPNYEVAPGFQALSVETTDGRSISGWLAGETETSVTLRTAFDTEESVLRQNIASLNASGISLMPDGLEQTMTQQELADLIAFLKK